jgi:hypothetical protein
MNIAILEFASELEKYLFGGEAHCDYAKAGKCSGVYVWCATCRIRDYVVPKSAKCAFNPSVL